MRVHQDTMAMTNAGFHTTRRAFLGQAVKLGAGSTLIGSCSKSLGAEGTTGTPTTGVMSPALPELPVRVFVAHEGEELTATDRQGSRFTSRKAVVALVQGDAGLEARVGCPTGPLSRVVLRWEMTFPDGTVFLGDHWERGYGDLQWRFLQPERIMPWYFAGHHAESGRTFMAGVKTQPSALCFWTVDGAGVSLWLDFRNGGSPSLPGDREIAAATVLSETVSDAPPIAALTRFCRQMCPTPRLTTTPICGNNNWYYAYGRDFDADAMRRDAAFLAELASGQVHRPYCVIDAGWTPGPYALAALGWKGMRNASRICVGWRPI